MLRLDVDDVKGAALAMSLADRELRNAVKKSTRARLVPLWRDLVESRARAGNAQDRAVYFRARPTVSMRDVGGRLTAATSGRALSGGLRPSADWPWVEFGSSGPPGRTGQLPRRYAKGRVAYAAVAKWGPAAGRVWLAVIAETYRDRLGVTGGT